MNVRPNDPKYEDLEGIKRAADRGREITRQLLIFSQRSAVNRQPVNLNDIVSRAVAALQETAAARNIEVCIALQPDLSRINGDLQLLLQVIDNLLTNACEAMPDGGEIAIQTHNTALDAETACQYGVAQPGPYVVLSVRNTGPAISEDHIENVWDPGFTTKAKHSGMGLAIVYAVVNQHDGCVNVENETARGTVFRVYLPAAPV